jgi:ribosomal protein L16 Arg81 hydroxylase
MRRWILNHPNQCKNLYMFPRGHPSERHSEIDWSKPNYEQFPLFGAAETNELIVRPGDVLYLPTNWFHYIISLNINFQCNTRSGRSSEYDSMVAEECGF